MDAKSIMQGLEEFRKYLLGEAPMLAGGVNDDVKDLVPSYFSGKLDSSAEIWNLFDYVRANPDRFEADVEEHTRKLLQERWERLNR